MGLAEKRVIKSFQEGTFKELVKKINTTAGKKLKIEVDWNSLAEDGMSHLYEDSWSKIYFEPVIVALTSVCSDDMGKEAVSGNLNTIIIKNEAGNFSPRSWSNFENKTLTLDHKPTTNIDDVKDRAAKLQEVLENGL